VRCHLWLTCAALLLPATAAAFPGRVVDRASGKPIAGAEVAIAGLAGTVRTDTDGAFVWMPDPPAPFDVIVLLPGGRLAKPVRILSTTGTSAVVIAVEPAHI
jgi:hypothetical protein